MPEFPPQALQPRGEVREGCRATISTRDECLVLKRSRFAQRYAKWRHETHQGLRAEAQQSRCSRHSQAHAQTRGCPEKGSLPELRLPQLECGRTEALELHVTIDRL